jgi:hypothetical protein
MPQPSISRKELFDLVWEKPLCHLAKDFNVSGSYLTRVCRDLETNKPPVGYWLRKELGRAEEKPDLNPPSADCPSATYFENGLQARFLCANQNVFPAIQSAIAYSSAYKKTKARILMSSKQVHGRCHCGQIEITATVDPEKVMACCLAIRCTPIASVMVITAGRPSGIAATAKPTTAMKASLIAKC